MGANNSIQHASVQYIITTVVRELLEDPSRRFSYVEQAFFQRWWREQTPAMQATVAGLVKSGQLELINGAWSMHGEQDSPLASATVARTVDALATLHAEAH